MKRRRVWPSLGLLLVGLLVTAAWLASARWAVIYQHRTDNRTGLPDFQSGISQGAFYFTYHPSRHFGMDVHWSLGASSGPLRWGFKVWQPDRIGAMRSTVIPLWSVSAAILLPAAVLVVRRWPRFGAARPCSGCGYSLVGLPDGAACPECGARMAGSARKPASKKRCRSA